MFDNLIKQKIGKMFLSKFRTDANSSPYDTLRKIINGEKSITFVDVGANTGQTIDLVKKDFKNTKIYSFEPTPELVKQLSDKYKDDKRVIISENALADFEGEAKFYTSTYSPTNSMLVPDVDLYTEIHSDRVDDLKNLKEITVPVTTLNNWYKTNNVTEYLDVIKIDTQGTELQVLKGADELLKDKIKIIVLEVQFVNFYKGSPPYYKIFEFLYENEFNLLDFFNTMRLNKLEIIESDLIFFKRDFFDLKYISDINKR
jgi:FkbM family methyltransferase